MDAFLAASTLPQALIAATRGLGALAPSDAAERDINEPYRRCGGLHLICA